MEGTGGHKVKLAATERGGPPVPFHMQKLERNINVKVEVS